MGGSILQLVATGAADFILIGEPQITLYKTVYRRYSNFAVEDVCKPMTGSGKFGGIYEATIDRDGDLLGNQSIEIDIDPLEMRWIALTTVQIDNLLANLQLSGRPALSDNLATWLGVQSAMLSATAVQYQTVAAAITAIIPTLPSDVDIAMQAVLLAIGNNATTTTVLGGVLQVLTRNMYTYWTPSVPAVVPIDFINLTGESKILTLRLTDGVELRDGLNSYLSNLILIGDNSEIALLNIIHTYTNQEHPIVLSYGTKTLVQVIAESLNISLNFLNYDVFNSYQFIVNNSGSGVIVTSALLNLTITRLARELPLILFYNASMIMNTLTTINELYGNIVYVKKPGVAFAELATNSNANMGGNPGFWNNFSTANLTNFLLSDFYMQQDMGLSKSVTYVINGISQTGSLEDSSSYAHMIKNTTSEYANNQVGAVTSASSVTYGGTFDVLVAAFVDPWPGITPDTDHPLSVPYLKQRFTLSGYSNVDYTMNDILYFDSILYYIGERFYYIFMNVVTNSSTIGASDKSILQNYAGSVRQAIIAMVTNYLFPIKFSQLASAVNANNNSNNSNSNNNVTTVYTFFKTQRVSVQSLRTYWFGAGAQLQLYHGYTNSVAVLGVILQSMLAITLVESAYIAESPILADPANIAQHPIRSPVVHLGSQTYTSPSYGTYTGVPYYPPMLYSETGTSGTGTATDTVHSDTLSADPMPYRILDNLAVYWCSLSRLNSSNYLDMYSNILFNADVIHQQVGQFSAKLMLAFIANIDARYGFTIEDNPLVLASLIASDPSVSLIRDVVAAVIGTIQLTLVDISGILTYYVNNRDLLAIRNHVPNQALMLDSIDLIATDYAVVVSQLYAVNSQIDQNAVANFFTYMGTFCYSVGELYTIINSAMISLSLSAPWKTDATSVALMNSFLYQISPLSMLINNTKLIKRKLVTVRDYLAYVFSIFSVIPDGIASSRPDFPILTDISMVADIMVRRARELVQTATNTDLLTVTVLSSVTSAINYSWIKRLGHYIFDWIEVKVGGETWDQHTCDYLDIWYELTGTVSQRGNYSELIGDLPYIYTPTSGRKPRVKLTVPLQFWYCKQAGWFYPLIASQYSQIVIRCKLREFNDCIQAPTGAYPIIRDRLNRAQQGTPSVRLQIHSKYVYLDSVERSWMAGHRHEYLYEYAQQHNTVVLDSVTYDWNTGFDLRTYFQNPCKAIIIQTRMRSMEFANQWSSTGYKNSNNNNNINSNNSITFTADGGLSSIPYIPILAIDNQLIKEQTSITDVSLNSGLIISEMGVKFNGVSRQNSVTGKYYANASTLRGWPCAPRDGIYSWNIGLFPSAHYPTGVANMSRIDDTTLHITLDPAVKARIDAGDAVVVQVFTLAYGVMRCMSGMAGRVFIH